MTDNSYSRPGAPGPEDRPSDAPLTAPSEGESVPSDLAGDIYPDVPHPAGTPDATLTDAPIADDPTPQGALVNLEQAVERAAIRGGPSWPAIIGMVALAFLILWLALISL